MVEIKTAVGTVRITADAAGSCVNSRIMSIKTKIPTVATRPYLGLWFKENEAVREDAMGVAEVIIALKAGTAVGALSLAAEGSRTAELCLSATELSIVPTRPYPDRWFQAKRQWGGRRRGGVEAALSVETGTAVGTVRISTEAGSSSVNSRIMPIHSCSPAIP